MIRSAGGPRLGGEGWVCDRDQGVRWAIGVGKGILFDEGRGVGEEGGLWIAA